MAGWFKMTKSTSALKIFLIFCVFLCIIGCDIGDGLQSNDVQVSASIKLFDKESSYMTYFNTEDSTGIKNAVRVDVFWKTITHKAMGKDKLRYAPYILVIPPTDDWTFIGGSKDIPLLYGNRTSIYKEIKQSVLGNNTDYNWDDLDNNAAFFQAKSFGQGFVTFSYINTNMKPEEINRFAIYYIYFDQNKQTGWYKKCYPSDSTL